MTTDLFPAPTRTGFQCEPDLPYWQAEVNETAPVPLSNEEISTAVTKYNIYLMRVAKRYFSCEADCHDALQDAYLAALRYRASFRRQSSVATWLHRILINACLMKLRSRALRRAEQLNNDQLPYRDEPCDSIRQEEERQSLRAAVCELLPDQRTVIQLRYFEGFSTEETAHLLNIRPGAVKTRLHRSCRALRQRLEQLALEAGDEDSHLQS